ncbi:histone-fold-containing protein [Periconia macrospinosa]|uniref:DNA polymerase epsilon subunit D n=1 Tax=Periconia macrospinosa TaxID=97972 RepID=A0A2V1DKZ2_9PLEO|nr:histone-fold-containing protein [Periconia macrospinosa]
MPARKSNVSTVSNDEPKDDGLNIEDLNLPKSIVQRLGKGVLPPNTQIQKDALLAMSKSATVFVNYLTSCAAENAARSGKKTVMPKDVFDAMHELEFEFMLPRLEAEVHKFTSIQADKRNTYRKKVREDKKAAKDKEMTNGTTAGGAGAAQDGEESPPAKRARLEGGEGEDEDGADADDTVDMGDGDQDGEDEEVEDDEVEEDEEEGQEEGLTEDPLEEREEVDDEDMEDAEESD